jgi:hypothetical protein
MDGASLSFPDFQLSLAIMLVLERRNGPDHEPTAIIGTARTIVSRRDKREGGLYPDILPSYPIRAAQTLTTLSGRFFFFPNVP